MLFPWNSHRSERVRDIASLCRSSKPRWAGTGLRSPTSLQVCRRGKRSSGIARCDLATRVLAVAPHSGCCPSVGHIVLAGSPLSCSRLANNSRCPHRGRQVAETLIVLSRSWGMHTAMLTRMGSRCGGITPRSRSSSACRQRGAYRITVRVAASAAALASGQLGPDAVSCHSSI